MVAVAAPPSVPEPVPPAEPEPAPPPGEPTPGRGSAAANAPRAPSPVGIRVSSAIGFEPLLLVYSADCPTDWQRTAQFNWTLDGKDLGQGLNGQRTIAQPGDYLLALRVVTKDGATHEMARRIRVLKSLEATALPLMRPGQ